VDVILSQFIYFLVGFFAGFTSGMFGIGGGSIRTPLLYIAGLHLRTAYGINFFVIPFSSFIGAFTHRRNIAKKIVIWVIISGVLGEIFGAFHVGFIPVKFLAIIYIILCFFVAFGIFLERIVPALTKKIQPNKKNFAAASFIVSYITGLRGGSGGQVFPALFKTLGLKTREAIATSLVVSIFTALGAIPIYWARGDLMWLPAISVLIGSIAGARIGSIFSLRTKPIWLEVGLSLFTILLALLVLIKGVFKS
jgi:uncharacterized membrane protein YfcA